MKLFQFELKKMIFNKRFLYLMLFILFFISALFLRNHIFQVTIKQEREAYILSSIQESERTVNELQQSILNNPNDEIAKEQEIQMAVIVNTLYDLRSAFNANNWRQELEIENLYLKQVQAYKTGGGEFSLQNNQINKTLALNAEHLATNIEPQHTAYSKAMPNFMKQVVDLLLNFGAIIILLIIIGDSLTREFKQRSIYFLFTQPLKKSTIIHSKFWSAFFIYVLIILCSFIVTVCIPFFFGEQGTFSYPILIEQNGTYSFITIKEYLAYTIISVTAIIMLVLSLNLFISLLFKNTIVSMILLVSLLIGGYGILYQLSFFNIEWYNPFQYVFTKETITETGYYWYKGIGVTLVLAFLCYFFAIWRIRFVRS